MLKKSEDYAGKWEREISPEDFKKNEKVFQILSDMMNERDRSAIYDTELKEILKEGGASDKFEFAKSVLSVMDFRVVQFSEQNNNDITKNDFWVQKEDAAKTIKRLGSAPQAKKPQRPTGKKIEVEGHTVGVVPHFANSDTPDLWYGYLDNHFIGRFPSPDHAVEAAKKQLGTKAAAVDSSEWVTINSTEDENASDTLRQRLDSEGLGASVRNIYENGNWVTQVKRKDMDFPSRTLKSILRDIKPMEEDYPGLDAYEDQRMDRKPFGNKKAKELSVPEKHQLAVAIKTLKMPDEMVGVMGGPTKEEARVIIEKLTGKKPTAAYITQNYPSNVDVNSFSIGDRVTRIWDSHGMSGATPYEGKVADLSPTTYQVMVVWPWSIEYEDPTFLVNLSRNADENPVQVLTTDETLEAAEKEAEEKTKEMAKASRRIASMFDVTLTQDSPSRDSSSEGVEKYNTGPHPFHLEAATEGPWKVQVTGVGEMVWSENALRFQTPEEAKDYAYDLLSRWFGADMARVVPSETPNREKVDMNDPSIVINSRSGSVKTLANIVSNYLEQADGH